MIEIIMILIAVGFLAFGILIGKYKNLGVSKIESIPGPVVNVDLDSVHRAIKEVPNKVLQSVVNSANAHKGALGELVGYIRLQAQYDRIIPLGSIVDFCCIKFSTDSRLGQIDFVDVKTGKNARLSKDQRALRELITSKSINFVELQIKELSEAPSQRS